MSMHPVEAGIPLLTEIILTPNSATEPPELLETIVELPLQPVMVASAASEAAEATPALALATPTDAATIERIAQAVHTTILRDLLGQVDLILEERIRASLTDVLQTAVDDLACQLRHGLKQVLDQVVTQAIEQEMARLALSENKNTDI